MLDINGARQKAHTKEAETRIAAGCQLGKTSRFYRPFDMKIADFS
jgi:hypothetical protein